MAIMKLNSSMVYWKVYHGDTLKDITTALGPYVSSIKIRKTTLPIPKNTKHKHTPTEATITVTSLNYIENIFLEGIKIKISMRNDRLHQPIVFSGRIKNLPEGSARDMLNYTIVAYGDEIDLADQEKNRTFQFPYKNAIIRQIALENGYIPNIMIEDNTPLQAQFHVIQKQETDLEFLLRCAKAWNCVCWFTAPKILNFADAKLAYALDDGTLGKTTTYILGYRTDKVPCNVETVSWKHQSVAEGTALSPSIIGYNEFGKTQGKMDYKIANYDNKTWELRPEYRNQSDPTKIAGYMYDVGMRAARGDTYGAIKKYYRVVKYNDNSSMNSVPPAGKGGGFEISVHLNEGDPELQPPRNALLYSGSVNPKADSSFLPAWLNKSGLGLFAPLKINETVLSYDNGMLRSELICTIGKFGD